MSEYLLAYDTLLASAASSSLPLERYLLQELPELWHAAYAKMRPAIACNLLHRCLSAFPGFTTFRMMCSVRKFSRQPRTRC